MSGRVPDTYKEVKVFEYPDMIIRVHIPDLTEDERKRRMKQIEKAAAELLISEMQRKAKLKEKEHEKAETN
jgi:ribosome recycling factor